MTYSELLLSEEWKSFRKKIIQRDNSRCQICHNEKIIDFYEKGVYEYSSLPLKSNVITIRELKTGKNISLKISPENYKKITTSCYLIFSISDEWMFIIGYRELYFHEKQHYFEKIKDEVAAFCQNLLSEKYPRGISKKHNLFEFFSLLDTSREVHQINDQLIFELPIQLENCNWIFFKGLHVHHNYYQKGRYPWEYPEKALRTLCWFCHERVHSNEKIPYLDENGKEIGLLTPCLKCFGKGWFQEHNHIQNGICFRCNGAKYEEFL